MDAQTVRDGIAKLADGYEASSSGNLLVPSHATGAAKGSRAVFYLPDGQRVEVDPDLPPIPPGLLHLDVWAGRAVPYIAWTTPSGTIDLTDVDGDRFMWCIREELCAMCALPLGWWKAWIMASDCKHVPPDNCQPANRESRVMTEPGMHRTCARYAQRVWWRDREWMLVTREYRQQESDRDPKRPIVVRIAPSVTIEHLTG